MALARRVYARRPVFVALDLGLLLGPLLLPSAVPPSRARLRLRLRIQLLHSQLRLRRRAADYDGGAAGPDGACDSDAGPAHAGRVALKRDNDLASGRLTPAARH